MSNLSKTDNYDVVIVGMGPTGLVLANLLGLEKLNVLVFGAVRRHHIEVKSAIAITK